MHHASHPGRGRLRALAPAALLLALCLLAGGAQAATEPTDMAPPVPGGGGSDRGSPAVGSPAAPPDAGDGEPFPGLPGPARAWAAGDVFSLHGVDQYRYIVAYTRAAADGPVHGCYEVEQDASGRYVVPQYVHGQEVFGDAFLAGQGARFLENVPLDEVLITDDTPGDGGRTYSGTTLGSLYGAPGTPSPTETPGPAPAAPRRPGPASPSPVPTHPPAARPAVTEPPRTAPTGAPALAPASAPAVAIPGAAATPEVTTAPVSPGTGHGKRYAVGDPGPFLGATFGSGGTSTGPGSPGAAIAPAVIDRPGSRAFGIAPPAGRFVRWYPAARWQAGIT